MNGEPYALKGASTVLRGGKSGRRYLSQLDLQVIWKRAEERKRSENEKSETIWDPKPSDLSMSSMNMKEKDQGRSEPVIVAKIWEDLWIGVKCQSNLELAGYLRKL